MRFTRTFGGLLVKSHLKFCSHQKKKIPFCWQSTCHGCHAHRIISDSQLLRQHVEVLRDGKYEGVHCHPMNGRAAGGPPPNSEIKFKSTPNPLSCWTLYSAAQIVSSMQMLKEEKCDLKFHSLLKHSHLVPKNETQQLGEGHWPHSYGK